MLNRLKPRVLIIIGICVMAIRAILQMVADRLQHHHDLTDFALGLLMGVGIGLTLLGMWRSKRDLTSS